MDKLQPLVKLIIVLFLLALNQGCMTGGYGQFYQPHADKQFPPSENVQLFQYSKESLDNLTQNGYLVIGSSSFNGPDQSNYTAINQAKKVGADIVLLNSKYTGTAHGSISLPEYHAPQTTTVTTHESGHINIYGAGGSAYGNFSGSSNSYITSPGYTTYKNVPFPLIDMITSLFSSEKNAMKTITRLTEVPPKH